MTTILILETKTGSKTKRTKKLYFTLPIRLPDLQVRHSIPILVIMIDPFTGKDDYFMTVGLNSNLPSFERKVLNLSILLDASGSMSGPFVEGHNAPLQKVTCDTLHN
jgi:hypothetical protein